MKNLIISFLMSMSFIAFAGKGHDHSNGGHSHHQMPTISEEKTIELGNFHLDRLIKSGKIDQSWKSAVHESSEKKKFKKATEWVVTFNNEKGVKGKKLFIFLKLSGEFVAANFTGK